MRKDYMLKRNGRPVGEDATERNGVANAPTEFKENARINAQIDGFIKQNSRYWESIKTMPRERLERTVVWQQLRYNARSQRLDDGLLRRAESDPDIKAAMDVAAQHAPESQRDRVRLSVARTLVFAKAKDERISQGAGVKA